MGSTFDRRLSIGLALDIGRKRRLVGIINARDASQLTFARAVINPLQIPLFADLNWSVHEYFDVATDPLPQLVANRSIRRNGRN